MLLAMRPAWGGGPYLPSPRAAQQAHLGLVLQLLVDCRRAWCALVLIDTSSHRSATSSTSEHPIAELLVTATPSTATTLAATIPTTTPSPADLYYITTPASSSYLHGHADEARPSPSSIASPSLPLQLGPPPVLACGRQHRHRRHHQLGMHKRQQQQQQKSRRRVGMVSEV